MPDSENTELPSIQDSLRQCVLFANLNSHEFQSVLSSCKRIQLASRESLFEQNQPARHLYFLERGLIKLYRSSIEGKEKVIDLIRPGMTFGEAIMFSTEDIYPVHAAATTASCVLSIDSVLYLDILHSSTDACFRVMALMSARLHAQVAEIDRLALHSAASRLAFFLCEHAYRSKTDHRSHVKLEASKQVLASKLSFTPETFSRILGQFQKDGLINVNENDIVLLDLDRLRSYMS